MTPGLELMTFKSEVTQLTTTQYETGVKNFALAAQSVVCCAAQNLMKVHSCYLPRQETSLNIVSLLATQEYKWLAVTCDGLVSFLYENPPPAFN